MTRAGAGGRRFLITMHQLHLFIWNFNSGYFIDPWIGRIIPRFFQPVIGFVSHESTPFI
jgi:hypothetical protein